MKDNSRRSDTHLFPRVVHDLIVCPSDDFPIPGFGWVRHDEIVGCKCIDAINLRIEHDWNVEWTRLYARSGWKLDAKKGVLTMMTSSAFPFASGLICALIDFEILK